jgi:hypothetical protein
MNAPVNTAIEGLQQSLTTLQTTMLQSDLIGSQAILRTIRASSSLENAQVAWGRFLNLPGKASTADGGDTDSVSGGSAIPSTGRLPKRSVTSSEGRVKRPETRPGLGKPYTHKELWGRDRGVMGDEKWEAPAARVVHHGGVGAENARVGRPFTV